MNRELLTSLVLFAATLSPATAQTMDDTIDVQCIVLLDVSGSMNDDDKFQTARDELVAKARQTPPSKSVSWLLIPFNDRALSPRDFRNGVDELEAFLAGLQPSGATNIADALNSAADLAASDADHLLVFLISDFEDTNQAGIDAAANRLDRLFADRAKRDLSQTVVWKSWGNPSGDLIAKINDSGSATIITAGDSDLTHATLDPEFELIDVFWSDTAQLEVTLSASLHLEGELADDAPPLSVIIAADGMPDVHAELIPGAPVSPIRFELPYATLHGSDHLDLVINVTPPPVVETTHGVVITTIAQPTVSFLVPVPPLPRVVTLATSVTERSPTRWVEPAHFGAEASLSLLLDITDSVLVDYTDPITLLVDATPGSLAADSREITVDRPGEHRIAINLNLTLPHEHIVDFTVRVIDPPSWLQLEQADIHCSLAITPPAPIITTLTASPTRISQPEWVDVQSGIYSFEADFLLRVDGQLEDGTSLTLDRPSTVTTYTVSKNQIRSGQQTVHLAVEAALSHYPTDQVLLFPIEELNQGAISIQCPTPLRIVTACPEPIRLFLAQGTSVEREMAVQLNSDGTLGTIRVRPDCTRLTNPDALRDLSISLATSDDVQLDPPSKLALHQDIDLVIRPKRPLNATFFKDDAVEAQLTIQPTTDSAAIVSTSHTLVLHQEAPFKRLLVLGLGITFGCLVLGLPGYLLYRLFRRDSLADDLGEPTDSALFPSA